MELANPPTPTLLKSQSLISRSNDSALFNIAWIVVTLLIVQREISLLNARAFENMLSIVSTLLTVQREISPLKDCALLNVCFITETVATFQRERSALKFVKSANVESSSSTSVRTQLSIDPHKLVVALTSASYCWTQLCVFFCLFCLLFLVSCVMEKERRSIFFFARTYYRMLDVLSSHVDVTVSRRSEEMRRLNTRFISFFVEFFTFWISISRPETTLSLTRGSTQKSFVQIFFQDNWSSFRNPIL